MAGSVVGRCARGGRGAPDQPIQADYHGGRRLEKRTSGERPGTRGSQGPEGVRASDVNGPRGPASLAPCGYPPRVAAPQQPGRIFLAGEMTGCCGAEQASPGGWVRNPGSQVRTRGRRADPARCGPRGGSGPSAVAPSTYPFPGLRTNRIGRRNLRNRKSLDPTPCGPATWAGEREAGHGCAGLLTGLLTAGPVPAGLNRTEPDDGSGSYAGQRSELGCTGPSRTGRVGVAEFHLYHDI